MDCTVVLCNCRLKTSHGTDGCPLLSMPKHVVKAYRVCNSKLMFFETEYSNSSRAHLQSARIGLVRVTCGSFLDSSVDRVQFV